MKELKESILIYSPMKEVFETLADPQNYVKFDADAIRAARMLTEGPIGKGSRFKGYYKALGEVEYEISGFKENQLIEQLVNTSFGTMRHHYIFEPTTGGTRLTQHLTMEPNILGEIAWPLLIKNKMSKRIHELNNSLKNFFEGLTGK